MEKQPVISTNSTGKRVMVAGGAWAVTYLASLLVLKELEPGIFLS